MRQIQFICTLIAILIVNVKQSKAVITDTMCTEDAAGNTLCGGVDVNSECSTGGKCACKTNFIVSADKTNCVQKITTVGCTPNDADEGDAKCQKTDSNSECSDGTSTCICKNGYKGADICVRDAVTKTTCTKNNADCTVLHSVCDNVPSTPKCKCSDGFKEDSNDQSTCVKIPVSETPCVANSKTDCTDTNSECDNKQTEAKCKCSDGYKEDSIDGSTCVEIPVAVTDITCSGGKTDCNVQHSECDNAQSAPKCKCSEGYKKDSTGGTTCVKIPAVLETACPTGNSDCLDTNSECDAAGNPPKCKCSDGFRQDTTDNTQCKKELGQTCSEGECLTNAECDTTCKCSDAHIEKDGLCVVPSSAIKAGLSEIFMMLWVLCVVILRLF